MRTLCIDVGGTGIKAMILDASGAPVTERVRKPTPRPALPDAVIGVIEELAKELGDFDRVSVGFPGPVRQGIIKVAPNLDPAWNNFPLLETLTPRLGGKPIRVMNDGAIQGLGVIEGKGHEATITLGTGLGCCLYVDGKPWQLELGHHPYRKGKDYEGFISDKCRKEVGKKRWVKRVKKAIQTIEALFNYDILYIGGGNARLLDPKDFPENVRIVSNDAGLFGGIRLWADADQAK